MSRNDGSSELISPEDARARAIGVVRALGPEPLPPTEAAGLVLAESLVAPHDLPRFDNAAMDGFAVRSADTTSAPVRLRIVGRAHAGRPIPASVGPGEAVAVATGAAIPQGSDAVLRVEDATPDGDSVLVHIPVQAKANLRTAGEDIRAGATVLEAGTTLGPGQVAAVAAFGLPRVMVHRRPRVAIVPTGDEVRPAGTELGPGQIHDAVSAPLAVLLAEAGAVPCPAPVAPDDPDGLIAALRTAATATDCLLTVGGVSMGERDLVRRLGELGDVHPLRVALRPAKPFAVGRLFDRPLFGLPGNPASALGAFEELVRPAILALLGRPPALRPSITATLAEAVRQPPGRLHLIRAEVWRDAGLLLARPAGRQGSGMIHSLARAQAWMVLSPEVEELPAGAEVQVRLLVEVP